MYKIKKFTVVPAIPERLIGLRDLAYNLWWTWNYDAVTLFHRLDPQLWGEAVHNPVRLLSELPQDRLEHVSRDRAYLAHLERVLTRLKDYMNEETWFQKNYPQHVNDTIAYFSMEFGLHECLPIYSGGLGVLAGDHMKSASDLGLPLVGVGLFYHHGYFQQFLSNDGWQFEDYPLLDIHHMPLALARDEKGKPIKISCRIGDRDVHAQIFKVRVGRVQLILLDALLDENHRDDRNLTMRLYSGDQEMRIRQEMLLGFGGLRALRALGHEPNVFHMNEGHSAFLALEQIGHLMESQGLDVLEAREAVAGATVFTTHTPVPAGIDTFPKSLIERYLPYHMSRMGVSVDQLMTWGQAHRGKTDEPFSMATLALTLSRQSNGVSKVHGRVAREMWQSHWPETPVDEIPIKSVTNGVHVRSWISSDVERLFERYLGPEWEANPDESHLWDRVHDIPDAELWIAHERRRSRLVVEARAHLKNQYLKRGASPAQIAEAEEVLDPEALTIGFARRFAPYKRATLLLRDETRLLELLTNTDRPVQFVFSGKAHPRDNLGKELIKTLIKFARRPEVRKRLVFIENYNMAIARFLVQGVDIWMNTPTKPLEASGTSGMKVTSNGGINFSVLDGWWWEAYNGSNGWAIGDDRMYDNPDYQNFVEGESIYDVLEREIIPDFYHRGSDGLPRKWIARMKASMRTCTAQFSSFRMVREYAERFYLPTLRRGRDLADNSFTVAKSLSKWKTQISQQWPDVKVESFEALEAGERIVGSDLEVHAVVKLGKIDPNDVSVQLYHGHLPTDGTIEGGEGEAMTCRKKEKDGIYMFTGEVPCSKSGQRGFTVRVVPRHPSLAGDHGLNLITWA